MRDRPIFLFDRAIAEHTEALARGDARTAWYLRHRIRRIAASHRRHDTEIARLSGLPLPDEDAADDDMASANAMTVLREMGYAMFEPAEAMLARLREE